jgi:succinate dehydrogenase/fumarate reductase cytochrome b subunit (b558 family)
MRTTVPVSLSGSDTARASSVPSVAVPPRVRQAFALSGLVPLGVFLVAHLAMNAQALAGGPAFASAVRALHGAPALPLFESLLVFAPLAFHAGLGAWLVATGRTLGPSPYPPAVRRAMRATAVVALAFIAMHLAEVRFHVAATRLDGPELATILDGDLATLWHGVPWRGIAYLAGSGCVVFHFAGGLWGFVASQRVTMARWTVLAAVAFGLVLWLGFADVVVLRATGAKLFGGERADVTPSVPCIVPPPR